MFKRGPNGEIRVALATGGTSWSQYAFQFGHEFGHILCNYDRDKHPNKWFEESICEVASLFALRQMARDWAVKPPYPNWKSYAKSLNNYADNRLKKFNKFKGKAFGRWLKKHIGNMSGAVTDRDKNGVVAANLLALFEEEPEQWPAVGWLNTGTPPRNQSFRAYLINWHNSAPKKHRKFIRKVAKALYIRIK